MSFETINLNKRIKIMVKHGNAMNYEADFLILKFAREHYGLDLQVSKQLSRLGVARELMRPAPDKYEIINARGGLGVKSVLFMGVIRLYDFSYQEIRKFSRDILSALSTTDCKKILLTIHGAGYGLDEVEAFEAEIAGLIDGITNNNFPKDLNEIIIIDQNDYRVDILKNTLKTLIPKGYIEVNLQSYLRDLESSASEKFRSVGYSSANKPHIFVAMPFKEEMYDTYNFGISGAVRESGYLCERADLESFTGDVMKWVKDRIKSSSLVIADLTGANANVYLEVGYAWGVGIPTILILNNVDELKFDVKSQKCVVYKNITDLKDKLQKEVIAILGEKN